MERDVGNRGTALCLSKLVEKSEVVRETIRRQAFDGTYFRDHALRDASGTLKARSDKTETCQYYQFSFGVASREAYPSLWERLTTEFGPGKTADGLHPSNMFLGQLLRLDLLGRFGRPSQELAEIKHYFGTMAKTSGALWEFADGHDSRCHGFGSYVAVLILRDILGVKEIDAQSRCVSISPGESPLVSAAAAVRTSEGTLGVRLLRESGRSVRNVELPSGWTAK